MYDRELLSVHRAIRFFEPIIDGRELYILTDHKPLIYAISKKLTHTSDRVVRQLEEISQYSTNIIHISGESNIVADALSRIQTISLPVIVTTEELATAQRDDPELNDFLTTPTNSSLELRGLRLDGTDSLVYCDVSQSEIRVFAPKTIR